MFKRRHVPGRRDPRPTTCPPSRPARYPFMCTVHPNMTGTLTVRELDGDGPDDVARHAPAGRAPRKRVLFGLFDADGWPLGERQGDLLVRADDHDPRLPARIARTTSRSSRPSTSGSSLWSPINFCPPSNETLPCPAPRAPRCRGTSPPESPAAGRSRRRRRGRASARRTSTPVAPTARRRSPDVYFAKAVGDGNLDGWKAGAAAPRGPLRRRGGRDRDDDVRDRRLRPGRQADDTTYSLTVANDGSLGEWATVDVAKLPVPLAGLSSGRESRTGSSSWAARTGPPRRRTCGRRS